MSGKIFPVCNISSAFAYKIHENKFTKNLKLNDIECKMEVIKMTKANAVAMNDMELDMVAGGGFFQELKEMREAAKIKENESTTSKVIKGVLITGLIGFVVGKVVSRGC